MIKEIFKNRLSRREKIIAQVCCTQVAKVMKEREDKGELTQIELEILPELEKIIEKLETT
jgi:hypothetical protein